MMRLGESYGQEMQTFLQLGGCVCGWNSCEFGGRGGWEGGEGEGEGEIAQIVENNE